MSALLSKLTMCVCAAGTGAAIVPTASAVQRHFKPKPAAHRVVARPRPAMAAIAAQDDCLPAAMLPPLGDGLAMGTGGPDSLFAPAGAPGGGDSGRAFPIGYGVPGDDRPGGVGGGIGGGGGTPGVPGGPGGPTGPGTTPPSPPSASPAPEPTSWALMLIGFGVLGGAMRYHHVRANAA